MEEVEQVLSEEAVKSMLKEAAVGVEMPLEFIQAGDVCQVAAAFACDAQLATWLVHLLEQQSLRTSRGRLPGSHQSSRSSANHDDLPLFSHPCHLPLAS